MQPKLKQTMVLLIVGLFFTVNLISLQSDFKPLASAEPLLSDNLDGNWTAVWSLDNPDNYTLTNIDLKYSKATLKLIRNDIFENLTIKFSNGTYDSMTTQGDEGIGLDLSANKYILIADTNNNRVIEIDYYNWYWQYGSNSTSGFGLNQLNLPSYALNLPGDKILITDTSNNRVIEVGRDGEFYWQYGSNFTSGSGDNLLNAPMSAVPMKNGNILIADSGNNYVIEVNRSKKIVWQYDISLAAPAYAEELSNGSILITDTENHRVVEVNKNKQEYWQHGNGKGFGEDQVDEPSFGTRLDNGHTLISDTAKNHRVVEVNNSNNIVWQYGTTKVPGLQESRLNKPTCGIRLANGNSIITDSINDRVLEVNSNGNWLAQYGQNATSGSGLNYLNTPRSGLPIYKDQMNGYYLSEVLDGGSETDWKSISWNQTLRTNSELKIFTRTGDTPIYIPANWSAWSADYSNPNGEIIGSPNNRYIQYKVEIITNDINVTSTLKNVTILGSRFEPMGELVTELFEPIGLLAWERFTWVEQSNGQTIQAYYSTDAVSPWVSIPGDNDLTSVSIATGKIRFKFELSTTEVSISPELNDFSLIYRRLGDLDSIEISPNAVEVVVGEQFNFTSKGFDKYSRELVIDPTWSSTVGVVTDGNFTAQTTPGTGYVNATEIGVVGSAIVTILAGQLDHIVVSPDNITIIGCESQAFFAKGFDKFNNEIPIEPIWGTNVGIMEENTLIAQCFMGNGKVTARVNDTIGIANVTVILNATTHHPPEITSRIPDQVKPEDSPPWTLKLTPFEFDDEDTNTDLLWYLSDVNGSLYSVTGAYSSSDELTFIPEPNAYGNNKATLWLVDSDNMTTSQALWINITSVNDKPVLDEVPDISVHYIEPYNFDYSNYVSDLETPKNKLLLSVTEPVGQKYTTVTGLNVTYNYPESMLGQDVEVTLKISDSEAVDEQIIKVSISDNYAPKLIKLFDDIIMLEGETKDNIFNLTGHFSDPDGDTLTFSSSANFIITTIKPNHMVTITAPNTWFGTELVTFRATDPKNAVAEGFLKVIVLEVNDPPQITPIPDIYVHYDYDYELNVSKYIFDPDNDTQELTIWTSDPLHILNHSYDKTVLVLNYPITFLDKQIKITLFVTDGINLTSAEFQVHVTNNFPPMLRKPLPDIYFEEDFELKNAINLIEYFLDKDGDTLSFSYLLDEENITATININYTVDFKGNKDWFGEATIIFKAADQKNAFLESEVKIFVIPVNDPPTIGTVPNQTGKVEERWVLDLAPYLNDIDNDINDLEIFIAPEYNALVTITGKQLTFHPNESSYTTLEFIVSDGNLNVTGKIQLIIIENDLEGTNEKIKIKTNPFWIWILVLIIILILLASLAVVVQKRRGNYTVTDVFILQTNGLLLHYIGNTLKEDMDEDIFGGMFTSIQSFVTDSFSSSSKKEDNWKLNQLQIGDHSIMIEESKHIVLTVIYDGKPGIRLSKTLKQIIEKMENKYGDVLENWDGKLSTVEGIEKLVEPILIAQNKPEIQSNNSIQPKIKK